MDSDVAAEILKDLEPLQEKIIVMEAAIANPPRDATSEDMKAVAQQLAKSREVEQRALDYLVKLGFSEPKKTK